MHDACARVFTLDKKTFVFYMNFVGPKIRMTLASWCLLHDLHYQIIIISHFHHHQQQQQLIKGTHLVHVSLASVIPILTPQNHVT